MSQHPQFGKGIRPDDPSDVSTPAPVREHDTWQGSEFLDDQIRTDESPEENPQPQEP
ncbi:hypothetical protein [Chitinophaga caseinilytica]|uniref:hypothetical protein n=1 Tax=Chitinophaga caseinilytica TaxID=2267521 RepID=UPI003C308C4F